MPEVVDVTSTQPPTLPAIPHVTSHLASHQGTPSITPPVSLFGGHPTSTKSSSTEPNEVTLTHDPNVDLISRGQARKMTMRAELRGQKPRHELRESLE